MTLENGVYPVEISTIRNREKCSICKDDIKEKRAIAARVWGKNYYFHLHHQFTIILNFCNQKEQEDGPK